ncbi:MAG: hypothetical protein KJ734_15315, partial [Chloroflexi bacterium]|nr:hypothetical protein [Chloroflexota bacterium]
MTIPARFALVAALGGLLIGSVMGLTACEAGARPSDATVPAPSPAATGVALPTPTTRPIAYPVPLTAQASPVSSQPGELESGGQRRHYLLHVPPGYAADQPAPLAINLHGLGSNAAQQEQISGMSRLADAKTFIVVYPEALGDPATWRVGAGSPDVAFIRDLIQHLAGQYRIDPARIYATGISNGGGMANRLGCDMADVIAAIAPVSGAYLFWQDCQPGRPVPVLAFHGTADRIVPYEGGQGLPFVREWAETWAARNG